MGPRISPKSIVLYFGIDDWGRGVCAVNLPTRAGYFERAIRSINHHYLISGTNVVPHFVISGLRIY
jgi:hypothetical protein